MQMEMIVHIWISSIDGSDARQVTTDETRVLSASFSPDGKHIALISRDVDVFNKEAHLYVMDHDGKNERQLTSGSEIASRHCWSPDGKWLAYGSRAPGEPFDSVRTYLIQPFNPGAPRLLCRGYPRLWLDNENLLVSGQMRTLRYPINGGIASYWYEDSTVASPIQDQKQLFYRDYRKGQEGRWVVSLDAMGRQKGEPRRIPPPVDIDAQLSGDRRFLIYVNSASEIWRVWTLTGKEERIGKALSGDVAMQNVSTDGKEILWLRTTYSSELVLVRNMFE
jgi:WD40 repeat protein